jgi:hypothetical protein
VSLVDVESPDRTPCQIKLELMLINMYVCRVFWSGAAANAVVVEADAFKESDVIYQAITSRGHHDDMLQTAELVTMIHFRCTTRTTRHRNLSALVQSKLTARVRA